MSAARNRFPLALLAAAVLLPAARANAQVSHVHDIHIRAISSNVIVPQSRSFAVDRRQRIEITSVKVGVVILEQAASTTMDIELKNPTAARIEAELLVPVPEGAAIRGFDFSGAAKEPTAELLRKDEAAATYKSIVAKIKDPALLEFAGYNLIRSSVFPVDPHGVQKVRLSYDHLLPGDGARVDYVLPRSESIDYKVPWEVSVKIKSRRPISTVYSPSHEISFERGDKHVAAARISPKAMSEPGPLQLCYLQDIEGSVTASLLAYPDPKAGGGYFLLLAGLPVSAASMDAAGVPAVKREVTVVLDRSGSMAGEKLDQVKAAALQIIEGLYDGEAFNIIDYSDSISSFAVAPVIKDKKNSEEARHYVRRLIAAGGTNIRDVLLEALRPKPKPDMLPIVLFLTDGLPTVGVRNEAVIRGDAEKANVYKRRIFTFGVGYDVNAPLLAHLANNSRAMSTFVLPKEEIEAKVSHVYRRLFGPVLASPELTVSDAEPGGGTLRLSDVLPDRIPDLFEGDQLVVLGKYPGEKPLRFRLRGDFHGKPRTFEFTFTLDKATTRNSFVPRLWASRKIAVLIEEIRQAGAEKDPAAPSAAKSDPKMKELVDEIVRLSVEFGILTEYTAFLAKEGTDLSGRSQILEEANRNLVERAQVTRSGIGAVNQAFNNNFQQSQARENRRNEFFDQGMNRVQLSRVQQINDRAFFQQGNRWIDGQALNRAASPTPERTVIVGSPEFMQLLDRLTAENRQGTLSLSGEILLHVDGRNILIKGE